MALYSRRLAFLNVETESSSSKFLLPTTLWALLLYILFRRPGSVDQSYDFCCDINTILVPHNLIKCVVVTSRTVADAISWRQYNWGRFFLPCFDALMLLFWVGNYLQKGGMFVTSWHKPSPFLKLQLSCTNVLASFSDGLVHRPPFAILQRHKSDWFFRCQVMTIDLVLFFLWY